MTDRRTFLRGLGAAAAVASLDLPARAAAGFHGVHQAGVLTPAQPHSVHLGVDVIVEGRAGLTDLLRTITDRARFLTAGGTPGELGITGPPADSGILGPAVPADNLTVTLGVGASLFDDRFGLVARKPAGLTTMPAFRDDRLDEGQCHGDLSLQLCADNRDTVLHALRDVARHTRGGMQIRWKVDGFRSPQRPAGAPRNLMGFKDGISKLDTADAALMDRLVWIPATIDQPWAAGGCYQVIRVIRMLVEFWDRVSIAEQERIFGRRRDTGAPLDGNREHDVPDYAADPIGNAIPLTAHMRRANPRTPETADSRLHRRPYNYDRGVDAVGDLDMGLVFCCYQQDIRRQFAATQKRLGGEPLTDYIQPFGGGYFLILPGVRDAADYLGRSLAAG